MTAAVPLPQHSSREPSRAAATSSSTLTRRSSASMPQARHKSRQVARVTPGRMLPFRAGVTTLPPILKKMFIEPTSSIYLRSTPSSQSTWA